MVLWFGIVELGFCFLDVLVVGFVEGWVWGLGVAWRIVVFGCISVFECVCFLVGLGWWVLMFVIYIGFEFDLFGLSCLFCFVVLGLFGLF